MRWDKIGPSGRRAGLSHTSLYFGSLAEGSLVLPHRNQLGARGLGSAARKERPRRSALGHRYLFAEGFPFFRARQFGARGFVPERKAPPKRDSRRRVISKICDWFRRWNWARVAMGGGWGIPGGSRGQAMPPGTRTVLGADGPRAAHLLVSPQSNSVHQPVQLDRTRKNFSENANNAQ